MKVNNGIIIDGVLHELKETKHKDCSKCSLRDLCQDEFGIACGFNSIYHTKNI